MFQAVVFDMDGLMFDTERMIQRSWDVVVSGWDSEKWERYLPYAGD